ncbi:MAG: lasso peptide biosynthesis B2 protein [Anaerolineae bacterium]
MRQRLRRASRLTPTDWATLARASVLLLQADLCLRGLGFAATRSLFAPKSPPQPTPLTASQQQTIERLGYLVAVAAQFHVLPSSCLTRSLVLQRLLGRAGIHADLRIGVRKEDGQVLAHAWLESDGQAIAENVEVEERFAPLVPADSGSEVLGKNADVRG